MCGIAGIFSSAGALQRTPTLKLLGTMADAIKHRGPDAEGFYFDEHLGFAHRRLSIIDLAGGAQPMQTPDGNLWITFNGEVFNFIELRAQLIAKGHAFVSQSDTEVILHLYREYGLEFPNYINGQFAIGLWDKREKTLVLARDRVGICPLYYYSDETSFSFASEIKALKPAIPKKLEIDSQSLDAIFTGWTCVPPATIFKNVFQLKPGCLLVINHLGITEKNYWDVKFPTSSEEYDQGSESILVEELREHLLNATKLRLRSDVPIGAYLSGGLDSSVLVAMMHTQTNARLRTFSLGFADSALDESFFQHYLVDFLGTQHSSIQVDYAQVANELVNTVWHTESPILRTAAAPMGILSKLVHSQGYKVVLTGEGADEVLGGYDIFKEAKVRQFWAKNPDSAFRPLLLKRLYPYMELPKGDAAVYLKKFFGLALDQPDLLWHSHLPRWQTTSKAKMFFSEDLNAELRERATNYETHIASIFPGEATSWHSFHRAQYLEIKTLMSGYLLSSQGDRMLARHSVEGRFPFLDHTLIEFANRLPPKIKMKAMQEKNILRKMAQTYLPPEISRRIKQPYRAPNVSANQESLSGGELSEYLSEAQLKQVGLFEAKKVNLLLKKARGDKPLNTAESQALTGILTTQILHKQFCR
ncbi:MAG: asparagine synthase (glutamine-hydrolyzing) [Gammaproteobacteria bacterium]|nr:MAG: asparagine synthase (glutamine-hydrolyzing) [Gammaproteobacteria bacterium]